MRPPTLTFDSQTEHIMLDSKHRQTVVEAKLRMLHLKRKTWTAQHRAASIANISFATKYERGHNYASPH